MEEARQHSQQRQGAQAAGVDADAEDDQDICDEPEHELVKNVCAELRNTNISADADFAKIRHRLQSVQTDLSVVGNFGQDPTVRKVAPILEAKVVRKLEELAGMEEKVASSKMSNLPEDWRDDVATVRTRLSELLVRPGVAGDEVAALLRKMGEQLVTIGSKGIRRQAADPPGDHS